MIEIRRTPACNNINTFLKELSITEEHIDWMTTLATEEGLPLELPPSMPYTTYPNFVHSILMDIWHSNPDCSLMDFGFSDDIVQHWSPIHVEEVVFTSPKDVCVFLIWQVQLCEMYVSGTNEIVHSPGKWTQYSSKRGVVYHVYDSDKLDGTPLDDIPWAVSSSSSAAQEFKLYYHATYKQHVSPIVDRINLTCDAVANRRNNDLFIAPAFYLGNRLDQTIDWCIEEAKHTIEHLSPSERLRHFPPEMAIVVYRVRQTALDERPNYIFRRDNDSIRKWKQHIEACRNGQAGPLGDPQRFEWIAGPLCTDLAAIIEHREWDQLAVNGLKSTQILDSSEKVVLRFSSLAIHEALKERGIHTSRPRALSYASSLHTASPSPAVSSTLLVASASPPSPSIKPPAIEKGNSAYETNDHFSDDSDWPQQENWLADSIKLVSDAKNNGPAEGEFIKLYTEKTANNIAYKLRQELFEYWKKCLPEIYEAHLQSRSVQVLILKPPEHDKRWYQEGLARLTNEFMESKGQAVQSQSDDFEVVLLVDVPIEILHGDSRILNTSIKQVIQRAREQSYAAFVAYMKAHPDLATSMRSFAFIPGHSDPVKEGDTYEDVMTNQTGFAGRPAEVLSKSYNECEDSYIFASIDVNNTRQ